jgi:tetratricopeptide (TPR) repeat protein
MQHEPANSQFDEQPRDSASRPASPPTIGKYHGIRVLGRGSNGVVWKAYDLQLSRVVALKLLHGSAACRPETRARFKTEARAGARLRHPNIVAVYDADEHEGELYIVQELVGDAETLASWIEAERERGGDTRTHFRKVADLVATLGDALQFAHDAGVVHRDVKPANVLITGEGQPKLADFGIAHLDDAGTVTATGDVRGTPAYMSPEQIDRTLGPIDARSDVYSLGATLFDALTLTRPFDGGTPLEVMQRVLQDGARDPREVRPSIPRGLAAICLKAMQSRPQRRYASASAMAEDLRRWLRDEPVTAATPGPAARLNSWRRRHPTMALATAAGVSLLAVVTWFALELRREALRSQRAALDALHASEASQRDSDTKQEALEFALETLRFLDPQANAESRFRTQELLRQQASRLERAFDRDPRIKATLSQSLARAAERWALYPLCEALLREAVQLLESLDGPWSVSALTARGSLGGVLLKTAKLEESHAQLAAVLNELLAAAPHEHMAICSARTNLAGERLSRGDFKSAEELLEAALRDHEPALGAHSDAVLRAHYMLATTLSAGRNKARARAELESVLARCDCADQANSELAFTARSVLGATLNALGEYEQARQVLAPAREALIGIFGPQHPTSLITTVNLADAHSGVGDYESALECFGYVLDERARSMPEGHPARLSMHSSVGLTLVKLGRYEEAEMHLRRVAEHPGAVELTGADVKSNARCNLALLLVETGRFEEAEAIARLELEARNASRPRSDRDRLFVLEVLVRALVGRAKFEEALPLARELVDATRGPGRELDRRVALQRRAELGEIRTLEGNSPAAK